LYGLADARDPRLVRSDASFAVGAIGAWGDLEVHRSGFRAEYATVLALAVGRGLPPSLREPHERAAERYGVELVSQELLEVTGLRHAAPIPEALLPGPGAPAGRPRPPGRPGAPGGARPRGRHGRSAPLLRTAAGRGVKVDDHTWLDATTMRCGITTAFARELGPGPVDLALPHAGVLHRTCDALAHVTGAGETMRIWTPLSATVVEVNPALADDPGLLLRAPEADGWLARLAPADWAGEAGGLEWGADAVPAYRIALDAPDPWAELRGTSVHVRSAEEVLAELRRRRALPRFADAAAVRAELVEPLAAALRGAPAAARALARLEIRIRFALTEPEACFTLVARPPAATVVADGSGPADVTLSLTTGTAERLLTRRLDIARALRSGEVVSDAPGPRTLGIASVLTQLPALRSRPVTHRR
jgi:glycine cleavage system H lipoate-binding protein